MQSFRLSMLVLAGKHFLPLSLKTSSPSIVAPRLEGTPDRRDRDRDAEQRQLHARSALPPVNASQRARIVSQ